MVIISSGKSRFRQSDIYGAEPVEIILPVLGFQVFGKERAADQFVGKGVIRAEECK
jgi:hypothetical protein